MDTTEEKKDYGIFGVIAGTGLQLTYVVPRFCMPLARGTLCVLPLRQGKQQKKVVGVFLQFCDEPSFACQEVLSKLFYTRPFPEKLFDFLTWVSHYYLAPFEKILFLLAPRFIWDTQKHSFLKKRLEKIFIEENGFCIKENFSFTKLKGEIVLPLRTEILLNSEQTEIYQNLLKQKTGVCLLQGVTSSGKTEIYLKLAQAVIKNQKNVLLLVPEIVLTPQMSARVRAVFGEQLAVLHSGLTGVEYEREWFRIHLGFAKIVLGVRTSLFSSLENLGLIIVDEEHDQSYKAQEFPCYHARDLAVVRAKQENALCLLGSATPSLESFFNVENKKYTYFQMKNKFISSNVKKIVLETKTMIRKSNKNASGFKNLKSSSFSFENGGISPEICRLLEETKAKNQQSLILLNRRGYFNYALCAQCFSPLLCPHCSVTTTLHQEACVERCHHCGYQAKTREGCPHCGKSDFLYRGLGTQNVQKELENLLPHIKFVRLDRDVLTSQSRLSKIIRDFQTGETDCLIGTQMLAKGHDFPKVTLVAILHLEDALFLPDFRASEKTFQLLTQAIGRASRAGGTGTVVLQSLVVGHPVITKSLDEKVTEFMKKELSLRQLAFHPPYCRQILFEFRHKKKEIAMERASTFKNTLIDFWQTKGISQKKLRIAGPYFAILERLQEQFRVQICIHAEKSFHPSFLIPKEILFSKQFQSSLRIDVDPFSFL